MTTNCQVTQCLMRHQNTRHLPCPHLVSRFSDQSRKCSNATCFTHLVFAVVGQIWFGCTLPTKLISLTSHACLKAWFRFTLPFLGQHLNIPIKNEVFVTLVSNYAMVIGLMLYVSRVRKGRKWRIFFGNDTCYFYCLNKKLIMAALKKIKLKITK